MLSRNVTHFSSTLSVNSSLQLNCLHTTHFIVHLKGILLLHDPLCVNQTYNVRVYYTHVITVGGIFSHCDASLCPLPSAQL